MAVTMRDIAIKTGYSLNTVSRAFNNRQDIGEETKKKILQVAQDMGYQVNWVAKALAERKTRTIGVIISDIQDPFFAELVRYLEWYARKNEYNIILCNTNEDSVQEENAARVLINHRVDGIIITPSQNGRQGMERIVNSGIPFVLMARWFEDLPSSYVVIDDFQAGCMAGTHLRELGHRNILFINAGRHISSARERLAGLKKAFAEPGEGKLRFEVQAAPPSMAEGYKTTKKLLKQGIWFSAIVAFCDVVAVGVIRALTEAGIRVPRDVSVIGFDNIELSHFLPVNLTTLDTRKKEIAREVIAILLCQMAGKEKPSSVGKKVKPQLIIRESTGPCRESAKT